MTVVTRILGPDDARDFEAFALPRVESSMFLLSNARRAGLVDRGARFEGTYAGAFDDGRMIAVAACYWNGVVVVQAPACLEAVVRAAADASGREVLGAIGLADQVAATARALGLPTGDDPLVQMDSREGLYSLQLQAMRAPASLVAGEVVTRRLAGRPRRRGPVVA